MSQPRPAEEETPSPLAAGGMSGAAPAMPAPGETPDRRSEIGGSLRAHAARGTLINSAFLTGLTALGLVKGFVLAAFLSRTDYGLWGVLAASLGTLVWLKQVGIGDKYIQQDEDDQELAFQRAFTLELFFTGGLVLLLAAVLPLFALIYGLPDLIAPGAVLLLAILAQVFQTPLWVFYRRMQFGRQRLLQAIDPVVGFAAALVLAVAGAGYWALVAGVVLGAWASAAAAVLFAPVRLRLRYDRGTLLRYVSFSWPLFVASLASVLVAQVAVIAAEADLGLAATGAIALAVTITAFTDRVDQIVTDTLYPAICAVADRTALLYESFVKSNRLALMLAVPFGVSLTLFCADLVEFGIGERWRPAVVLLQVYGLAAALNAVGFNWEAYFRARGETRPMAVAGVAALLAFLGAGLPLLFAYGLRGFAMGVAVQVLVHLAVRAVYLQRLFAGFTFLRHAARAFAPTVPALVLVLLLRLAQSGERTLAIALGELALYVAVAAAATWWLESRLLREAFGYLGLIGRVRARAAR